MRELLQRLEGAAAAGGRDPAALKGITVVVRKAEGSARGDGWYYLLSGQLAEAPDHPLRDVGGEDWFPSRRAAQAAARDFLRRCRWSGQYGWVAS
jgi:hypothetical protein